MENSARAIIAAPKLLLPLFAVILGVLMFWVPQVLLLGIVVAVVAVKRHQRKHRFDAWVSEMLKSQD